MFDEPPLLGAPPVSDAPPVLDFEPPVPDTPPLEPPEAPLPPAPPVPSSSLFESPQAYTASPVTRANAILIRKEIMSWLSVEVAKTPARRALEHSLASPPSPPLESTEHDTLRFNVVEPPSP